MLFLVNDHNLINPYEKIGQNSYVNWKKVTLKQKIGSLEQKSTLFDI